MSIVGKTHRLCVCYFSGLMCLFNASVRVKTFFFHCAAIQWINKHPESWRDGQIHFLNVFNAILGRIQCSVLFFRKFFVRAILYASSNYGCEEYSFERPDIIYKDLYIRTKLLFRRKCCVKKIISKSLGKR